MNLKAPGIQYFTFGALVALTALGTIIFYYDYHQDYIVYNLAEEKFYDKNFKEAITLFKKSLELGLPPSVASLKLADSYISIGQFEEAIPYYRERLLSHPKEKSTKIALAKALMLAGKSKESEEMFKSILGEENETK